MKKVLFASMLAFAALTASAQAVTGNVGINSNNIYRGQSVSDNKSSATVGLGVSAKVAAATVYGDVQASTAVDNGKVDLTIGATVPVGVLTVGGGYRNHSYVNKSFEFDKSVKAEEVFVGASVPVAGGKLSGEYSRNFYPNEYKADFMRVGYARQVLVPQLTVGVAVTAYDRDVVRLNGYEATAVYALTKNLNVNALVAHTRTDAFSDKMKTVGSVGVAYKF
jgi:Gram-negative porin